MDKANLRGALKVAGINAWEPHVRNGDKHIEGFVQSVVGGQQSFEFTNRFKVEQRTSN